METLVDKSSWEFNGDVVPVFDKHVRDHVPMYEEFHRLITDISGWFIDNETSVYDIGTSLGEVIKNLKNVYKHKNVKYFGVDASAEMVNEAKSRFLNEPDVFIELTDVTSNQFEITNASLVTSVLSMMFIKKRYRQDVVNKIHNGLNDGGAFVLVEKVVGNNANFDSIFVDLYHEFKLRNGLTEKQVIEKSRSIRGVLRPNTFDENIKMLNDAGFENIDTFFKWNNFAGIVAIKGGVR